MSAAEMLRVFFYGLFMDVENLRRRGITPGAAQVVTVRDHVVRLAAKAILLPAPGESAQGVLVTLAQPDLTCLYTGMPEYREATLVVELPDGSTCPAITMVHDEAPRDAPRDPAYAAAWMALVRRLGFDDAAVEPRPC